MPTEIQEQKTTQAGDGKPAGDITPGLCRICAINATWARRPTPFGLPRSWMGWQDATPLAPLVPGTCQTGSPAVSAGPYAKCKPF